MSILHPWDSMTDERRAAFVAATKDKIAISNASLSDDGLYRYTLTRLWTPDDPALRTPSLAWVMLNPSTADAKVNDATIRVCMGRARRLGYSGITVVNLYAFRATQPSTLWHAADPVGPLNDWSLRLTLDCAKAGDYGAVVCGWGDNAKADRVSKVLAMFAVAGVIPYCLGTTKAGQPKHPLLISYETPLQVLPVAAASAG